VQGAAWFVGVLGFDKCFQICQVHFPEIAILIEPGIDGTKRFGIELIDAVATFAVFANQMGAAKEAKVLGDRRTRDGESPSDFTCRLAAAPKQIEDSAAGGVGQSLESSFRRICNRTVSHNA